jgi:hypothetical protein
LYAFRQLRAYNRSAEYESCETDRFGTRCPGWEGDRAARMEDAVLAQAGGRRGANFGLPRRQVDVTQVATFFAPGFGFSAVEPLDKHQVVDFDSLSVKVQFAIHNKKRTSEDDDDAPNMLLPLVRGMPYATAVYSDLTPFLYTNNAILVRPTLRKFLCRGGVLRGTTSMFSPLLLCSSFFVFSAATHKISRVK